MAEATTLMTGMRSLTANRGGGGGLRKPAKGLVQRAGQKPHNELAFSLLVVVLERNSKVIHPLYTWPMYVVLTGH